MHDSIILSAGAMTLSTLNDDMLHDKRSTHTKLFKTMIISRERPPNGGMNLQEPSHAIIFSEGFSL